MKIDITRLVVAFNACKGRVKYKLGAKAALSTPATDIKRIDCSGWARWHVYHASKGAIKLPDGSQNQLSWARKNLRKLAKYSDVQYAANDPSRVFIAFLSPKPGAAWPRHVWIVTAGKTMESYGSGGVNSRKWDATALKSCRECFELEAE